MNILPVNYPKIYNTSSVQNYKKQNEVTFGIRINTKPKIKSDFITSNCRIPFIDFVEYSANQHNKKLEGPAKYFLDDVSNIANILNPFGVSFDRKYCEPNVIKSGKTVAAKIQRSKTFRIPDRLRATLYSKEIYDMDILFNHILPEFEKLGYSIAYVEVPLEDAIQRGYYPSEEDFARGYTILPDIDIRLRKNEKKKVENIQSIPQQYKYSLGEPKASGYEDIQIRFVKNDGNKSPTALRELIILTGPNYAKTKHYESEKIYSYTRQFKELNILNSEDKDTVDSLEDNIKVIKETFSDEITRKLYGDAKSLDRFGGKSSRSISINKTDETDLTTSYNNIDKITLKYYLDLIENTTDPDEKEHLEALKDADLEKLGNIRRGLTKAFDFYKKQYPPTE